jgi:hypothetical protein
LANAPKLLSKISEEAPNEGLSELNLAFLRKLAKTLSASSKNSTDIGRVLTVKIIGHLNLAARNLVPEPFNRSELSLALIEHFSASYFSGNKLREDGSSFADSLTSPIVITNSDWPGTAQELIKQISQSIEKKGKPQNIEAVAQCTLSTGWAQELFGHSTQVFTPAGIAKHLAAEVFEGQHLMEASLLDPACGAGHLLIPAAEHWLSLANLDRQTDKKELLKVLFSQVITGLDIDSKLLELCGFAFYLLARDKHSELCELPLPRLFLSKSAAGSLTLTVDECNGKDWAGIDEGAVDLKNATYNQIVMNPPYLSTRIMGDTTADFLRQHYPDSAGDLYTAFIELAAKLLAPGGKLSMIVQQSFLSVQRYRAFRLKLLEQCHISSCLTLGSGSFSARPGEKVNSAILTLEKKSGSTGEATAAKERRMMRVGRMEGNQLNSNNLNSNRLNSNDLNSNDSNSNLIAEETALATMNAISGNPFAFDCPPGLANCFKTLPALSEIDGVAIVNGLFTCNNKMFVKLESELDASEKHLYVPYDKGGGQKWYHQTNYRLHWQDKGESIRQYRKERGQSRALPGEEFYFKPGLTYSYIGTTGFKARLLSENSIFDIASSAIFSEAIDHHYLLGFLNSSLAIYLLGVLNPTINFQIGDLRRLPFCPPSADAASQVATLVKAAISLVRNYQENPLSIEAAEIITAERSIQEEIDTIICELYKIDRPTEVIIKDNEWVVGSRKKLIK